MIKPKRKMDWKGLKVTSNVFLKNGTTSLPAGTEYLVRDNHGGLALESLGCEHCGLKQHITKVSELHVKIIDCELNYDILNYNIKCVKDPRYRHFVLRKPENTIKPTWQNRRT